MADKSSKHEIMKMLLSSPNPPPKIFIQSSTNMDTQENYESDSEPGLKLYAYLQQLNEKLDDINVVDMDHSYSLPWHSRPDNCFAKPAKLLFVSKIPKVSWNDSVIDPVEVNSTPKPIYDPVKTHLLMDETSRLVSILRPDPGDPDWEIKIDRTGWTGSQNKLFDRVLKMLHMEQLSRLGNLNYWNEAVQRRISLDKAAKRFRTVMSAISWKPKLTHWLHNLLLDNLDVYYLTIYIDILQTLYRKVPVLLERLISGPSSAKINPDALNMLVRKSWDPASTALNNYKPKRLPGNPLIVIVPNGMNSGPKNQRWLPYLSSIGEVVSVTTNTSNKITVTTSLEHMMSATRAKLAELRSDYMGKPIILLGIYTGAALACQVALIEQVKAVVCLGFPVNTVEGKRGQADDNLLNLTTPILIAVGEHAATSYVDDVEDIREKLKVENGLIVVGSGDDQLRIPKATQKAEGLTQNMLDRCIIDEVGDFLGAILSPKAVPHTASHGLSETRSRFKVVEKKRKISIQEEIYPRKQLVHTVIPKPGGITLNVTTNRRGVSGRGRGRSRYITQPTTGGIAISRRGGMTDKGITRPSIENISVINTSNIDHTTLSGEASFKILPQIKVLSNDNFTKIEAGDAFSIDQLTPDRLLEMPVIIAPDNQEDPQESQIKVVMGGPNGKRQDGRQQSMTLNRGSSSSGTSRGRGGGAGKGDVKTATIYFRKRGGNAGSTRFSVDSRQVRKPRLQQFPANPNQK